jgi:alpha-mannosidase
MESRQLRLLVVTDDDASGLPRGPSFHLHHVPRDIKVAIAANDPLVAVVAPAAGPKADLPESRSFLPFSAPNLVLSAMKKAETDDAVILRLYDIEGKDTETAIELFAPVKTALRTNIIEEDGAPLKPVKGRLVLPVGHHAVETVKLVPGGTKR